MGAVVIGGDIVSVGIVFDVCGAGGVFILDDIGSVEHGNFGDADLHEPVAVGFHFAPFPDGFGKADIFSALLLHVGADIAHGVGIVQNDAHGDAVLFDELEQRDLFRLSAPFRAGVERHADFLDAGGIADDFIEECNGIQMRIDPAHAQDGRAGHRLRREGGRLGEIGHRDGESPFSRRNHAVSRSIAMKAEKISPEEGFSLLLWEPKLPQF